MEAETGPSKGKLKICSKSLKEDIRKNLWSNYEKGITINFINYMMNQIQ
jgi:hypothetical protein